MRHLQWPGLWRRFLAAPEADPADGWLDVMIVRRVGRLTIAKLLGMYKAS